MRHARRLFAARPWAAVLTLVMLCACDRASTSVSTAREQVLATERAFARSMAERDFTSFQGWISEEAVFFSGPEPLRGRSQVAQGWQRYFNGPQAPFSWEPDRVEVLESGTLALSTGPVFDPQGRQIARFVSIWRLESPGQWRIVFDRGESAQQP